jgi:hypothetical protein
MIKEGCDDTERRNVVGDKNVGNEPITAGSKNEF